MTPYYTVVQGKGKVCVIFTHQRIILQPGNQKKIISVSDRITQILFQFMIPLQLICDVCNFCDVSQRNIELLSQL